LRVGGTGGGTVAVATSGFVSLTGGGGVGAGCGCCL